MPVNEIDIAGSVHLRNPFNHPAVAFRLESALSAGGYEDMPFEDWHLWAKMIKSGAKISNRLSHLCVFEADMAHCPGAAVLIMRGKRCHFLFLVQVRAGRWVVFFVLPARLTMRLLPARVFR